MRTPKPRTKSVMQQPALLLLLLLLVSSFFFCLVFKADAGILPPAKLDGFVYENGSFNLDSILIEVFYDPLCPYSRDSWPPLKRALHYYGSREKFYGAQTQYLSRASVVEEVVKSATEVVGRSYYDSIKNGFNDRKTNILTTVSFTYAASRGVYGTPSFYVNGFLLPDTGAAVDYNTWRKVIDPLIGAKSVENEGSLHFLM